MTHIDQSYISQLLTAMEGETFLEKRGEGKDVGWQDFFVFVLFRLGRGGRDIQVIRVPPPPPVRTEAQITYNKRNVQESQTMKLLWELYCFCDDGTCRKTRNTSLGGGERIETQRKDVFRATHFKRKSGFCILWQLVLPKFSDNSSLYDWRRLNNNIGHFQA